MPNHLVIGYGVLVRKPTFSEAEHELIEQVEADTKKAVEVCYDSESSLAFFGKVLSRRKVSSDTWVGNQALNGGVPYAEAEAIRHVLKHRLPFLPETPQLYVFNYFAD